MTGMFATVRSTTRSRYPSVHQEFRVFTGHSVAKNMHQQNGILKIAMHGLDEHLPFGNGVMNGADKGSKPG